MPDPYLQLHCKEDSGENGERRNYSTLHTDHVTLSQQRALYNHLHRADDGIIIEIYILQYTWYNILEKVINKKCYL